MSRTLLKDTFRSIASNKLRFISIIIIVALGMGFFVGIKSSPTAMRNDANEYFVNNNLMDIRVTSSIVFTDDDVETINKMESVDAVAKSKYVDGKLAVGKTVLIGDDGQALSCRVSTQNFDAAKAFTAGEKAQPDYMNRLVLVNGTYPQSVNECVIDSKLTQKYDNIKIGQTISISGDESTVEELNVTEFKIVGTVKSPLYISTLKDNTTVTSGSLNTFIYVDDSAFLLDEANELFVKMKDSDSYDKFSSEYEHQVAQVANQIQSLSKNAIDTKLSDLKTEYSLKLSAKEREISEYDISSQKSLDEKQKKLNELNKYVSSADDALEKTKEKNKTATEAAKVTFTSSQGAYSKAKAAFENHSKEFDNKSSEIKGYSDLKKMYDEVNAKQLKARPELDKAKASMNTAKTLVDNKNATIKNLENSSNDYKEKKDKALQDSSNLDTLKNEVSSLTQEVNSIQAQIDQMKADLKTLDPTSDEYRRTSAALKAEENSLEDAKKKLSAKESEKVNAEKAKKDYDEYKAKYEKSLGDIASAKSELTTLQTSYDTAKNAYDSLKSSFDADTALLNQYKASMDKLTAGQTDLLKLSETVAKEKAAMDSAAITYTQEKIKLTLAERHASSTETQALYDLSMAKNEYNDVNSAYKKEEVEIQTHKNELQGDLKSLKNTYKNLDSLIWTTTAQSDLKGNESFKASIDNMRSMTVIFPVVFLVIAMLACFVIMIKNVEDERSQIGVFKAIGYSDLAVVMKYLFYALLAWILGAVIGLVFGTCILPSVIYTIYEAVYTIPKISFVMNVKYVIIGTLVSIGTTLIATLFAIVKELGQNPSELMRPQTISFNRHSFIENVPGLWKKLSYGLVILARTITRSRRRIIVGTLGIACCAALVLSSIGLVNSAVEVSTLQYGKHSVFKYDLQLSLSTDQDKNNSELMEKIRDDIRVEKSMLISKSVITIATSENDGNRRSVNLIVPADAKKIDRFISLDKVSGADNLSKGGMIISQKLSQLLNINVGDSVKVTDAYGETGSVKVVGIVKNYINHYAYMSEDTYKKVFTSSPEFRYVFCNFKDYVTDKDINNFSQEFTKENVVVSTSSAKDMADTTDTSIERVLIVVMLFVASACLLAFILMYTISNINLSERAREIANIKVIGFSDHEVLIYVIRENIVSSVFGILVGLVGGIFLHKALIGFITVENILYNSHIFWWGYFVMIGIIGLLAVIAALPIRLKINRVNMAETLKAID